MAGKNRRRKSGGFAFPVPFVAIPLVVGLLALLYVWLDARSNALGARIKTIEREVAEVNQRYAHELSKWEIMKSPVNIERALARYNIVMIWPSETAIVRLQGAGLPASSAADLRGKVAQAVGRSKGARHD